MRALVGSLIALIAVCASASDAIEADLVYTPAGNQGAFYSSFGALEFRTAPPPGEWKLPKPSGGGSLFTTFTLGSDMRLIMLDRRDINDPFFSRVRIDLNRNRDLTDDKPIECKLRDHGGSGFNLTTDPIDTTYSLEGKPLPFRFVLDVTCFQPDKLNQLGTNDKALHSMHGFLRGNCWYTAALDVDGKHYDIVLVDHVINGRLERAKEFSKFYISAGVEALGVKCDDIYISSGGESSYHDRQAIGNYLVLGDKLYRVQIDLAGGKIGLEPAEGCAAVSLPDSVKMLSLVDEKSFDAIAMFEPARTLMLPAGEWRLVSYEFDRQDAQGDHWVLAAQGSRTLPAFNLTTGTTTALVFGEPFTALVSTDTYTTQGFIWDTIHLRMSYYVKDSAGSLMTVIADVSHDSMKTKYAMSEKSRYQPKEATWEILSDNGRKLASGQFEYG